MFMNGRQKISPPWYISTTLSCISYDLANKIAYIDKIPWVYEQDHVLIKFTDNLFDLNNVGVEGKTANLH